MKQLKLIEPDIYDINTKIDELKRFFLLTRNFSVKIGNHLKILFHLVSTMIDSDDFIQIIEEKLNLSQELQLGLNTKQNKQETTETLQIRNDNKLVEILVSAFQQQNENLWKHIERGEQNTQYIKDFISKQNSNLNFGGQSVAQTNKILGQTLHNFQIPQEHSQKKCFERIPLRSEINFQERQNRKSVLNSRSFSRLRFTELDNEHNSSSSLQKKVGQMNLKIKKLKAQRKNDEKGLNEMIKKLVEIKAENEDALQQKDSTIKDLKKQIQNLKQKYSDLAKEKKSINKQLKKVLKQKSGIFQENDLQNVKKLQKENENLKKILEKENRKNGKTQKKQDNYYAQMLKKSEQEIVILKEQLKEYQEKNISLCKLFQEQGNLSIKKIEDSTKTVQLNKDLLKCLFIQSQSLEARDFEFDQNLSIHDDQF